MSKLGTKVFRQEFGGFGQKVHVAAWDSGHVVVNPPSAIGRMEIKTDVSCPESYAKLMARAFKNLQSEYAECRDMMELRERLGLV